MKNLKKIAITGLCTTILLAGLTGCKKKEENLPVDDTNTQDEVIQNPDVNVSENNTEENIEVVNPYQNYESFEKAQAALNFVVNPHEEIFKGKEGFTYIVITDKGGQKVFYVECYEIKDDILTTISYRVSDVFEGKELAGVHDEMKDAGVDSEGKHVYESDNAKLLVWDEDGIHYSLYTTENKLSSIK